MDGPILVGDNSGGWQFLFLRAGRVAMPSLEGCFLVASPHLGDRNFFRTVVLMIRHDADGALGVVLNRPTDKTIADVWRIIGENDCAREEPVYLGGPVAGPLMALHGEETLSDNGVVDGVYFTTQRDKLIELVKISDKPLRMFSGYSGWGGGQLERELSEGSWLVCKAYAGDVFATTDEAWRSISTRIGLEILGSGMDVSHAPPNPELN